MFNGNAFLFDVYEDVGDERKVYGTVNSLSGMIPDVFFDLDVGFAANAISAAGDSNSVFMSGGIVGHFLMDRIDGVRKVVQGRSDAIVLLSGGISYGNGTTLVVGGGIEDIDASQGVLYYLSSGQWFARYGNGSVSPFLSGVSGDARLSCIGNSGDETYFSLSGLHRVVYSKKPDVQLEQMSFGNLAGRTAVDASPTPDGDYAVVSRKDGGNDCVQVFNPWSGGVSGEIPFASEGSPVDVVRAFPVGESELLVQDSRRSLFRSDLEGNSREVISSDLFLLDPALGAFKEGGNYFVFLSERDGFGFLGLGTSRTDVVDFGLIQSSERIPFTDIKTFRGYPIAASEKGIYGIRTDGDPIVYRKSLSTDPVITGVFPYSFSTGDQVLVGYGDRTVLSSDDCCNFGKMFEVGDEIRSVYPRNKREYYAGTKSGMYRTHYMYDFVNNTHNLTMSEIKDIVDDGYSGMVGVSEAAVSVHIADDHGPGTEISAIDSEAVDSRMSNVDFSQWQTIMQENGETVVANDVVYRMEFGDQTNGDIQVSCQNFISSWQRMDFSYIMKQWKSGMVELMLYIPTTHTYYIGNLSGCPQYEVGDGYRPNISALLDPDRSYGWSVPETETEFTVTVDGSVYRMQKVVGTEVYGNSLPLGIFAGSRSGQQLSAPMYNSMILPSIVTGIPQVSADEMNEFRFKCFGTDAQAVQITYIDNSLAYNGETFSVRFNPQGASGSMSDQIMEVDVDEVGVRKLRKCGFYWPGSQEKLFLGWAFYPQSESDPRIDVQDGQAFDWREYSDQVGESVEKGVLNLYAVWFSTDIGDVQTELVLEV